VVVVAVFATWVWGIFQNSDQLIFVFDYAAHTTAGQVKPAITTPQEHCNSVRVPRSGFSGSSMQANQPRRADRKSGCWKSKVKKVSALNVEENNKDVPHHTERPLLDLSGRILLRTRRTGRH